MSIIFFLKIIYSFKTYYIKGTNEKVINPSLCQIRVMVCEFQSRKIQKIPNTTLKITLDVNYQETFNAY
jgi:hypothetical protein